MDSDSNKPNEEVAEKQVPVGLYILSALLLLSTVALIYYAFIAPGYQIIAAIYGPLLLYTGLGLVPRWKGARLIAIVLLSLTLIMALANMGALFLLVAAEELGPDGAVQAAMRNGIRILLLPFILVFLFGKRVRKYYARPN